MYRVRVVAGRLGVVHVAEHGQAAARILVWKGGARTRVRTSSAGGATIGIGIGIGTAAGRLVLTLSAKTKAFKAVRATLARRGTRLVVTLERAPVVTPPSRNADTSEPVAVADPNSATTTATPQIG